MSHPNNMSSKPLEQPVIVHHLSRFLSSEDPQTFQNFRQVCRLWRSESQLKWNQFYRIFTIYSKNAHHYHCIPHSDNMELHMLDQFRQRYSNPKDNLVKYPHQKYQLCFWEADPVELDESEDYDDANNQLHQFVEDFTWFWGTCSYLIKQLYLHHSNSISPFSSTFLQNIPNLTNLKIIGGSLFPQSLICTEDDPDYFKHPNLKTIHLELVDLENDVYQLGFILETRFSALKTLKIGLLRRNVAPEQYQPSSFYTRVTERRHGEGGGPKWDNFEIREYTSANVEHRTLEKLPICEDISSVAGIVENLNVKLRGSGGRLTLDLFENPGSVFALDRIHRVVNFREVEELNLWGGICGSLRFLSELKLLRVVRWRSSCWGNVEYMGKMLRWVEEGKGEWRLGLGEGCKVEETLSYWGNMNRC